MGLPISVGVGDRIGERVLSLNCGQHVPGSERGALEPGMGADEILGRFSDFEREEIAPVLTPAVVGILVDALENVG
jgi:hypothetical protein